MRVQHTVNVQIAEDADMKNLLYGPSVSLAQVVIDSYESQTGGTFTVAAGATESLKLGDVTAPRGVYLRVDNDCQVNINGLGPIQLRRGTGATGFTAKLFMEGEISSVAITAPVGTEIHGTWCFWGDLAS